MQGFHELGAFWRSDSVFKVKQMAFSSKVVSNLLTGAEGMNYTATDYNKFDNVLVNLGRKVLRGEACERLTLSGAGECAEDPPIVIYKARTNYEVLKMMNATPTAVEARFRRLSWLQNMLGDRPRNHQMLAALFGQCRFESTPTIGADHRLTATANSWARRVLADETR